MKLKHLHWFLLLFCLGSSLLFTFSEQKKEQLQQTVEKQQTVIKQLEKEKQAVEAENKQLLLIDSIDKKTIESIRQSLRDRRQELGELKKELAFYRGLMTSDDRQRGLSIREFHVEKVDNPRTFLFSLVMQQLTTQHKQLKGRVTVMIIGKQNGIDFNHPLSSLSDDIAEEGITLSFKYFQIIEGHMMLPEGFQPIEVMIGAETKGKTKQKAQKTIAWADLLREK